MVLSLLIAKGWRVTTVTFERSERLAIVLGAAAYVVVYALVYCVDLVQRDPADDVYPLLTGGAAWLVVFRLGLLGLCSLFFLRTYDMEMTPAKRHFYRRFMVCALLWFLALPISIFISLCMSEWMRHRHAMEVMYWLTHLVLAIFLYTLRPKRAKGYFTITAYRDELDGLVGARGPPRGEDPERDGARYSGRSLGPGHCPENGHHSDDGDLGDDGDLTVTDSPTGGTRSASHADHRPGAHDSRRTPSPPLHRAGVDGIELLSAGAPKGERADDSEFMVLPGAVAQAGEVAGVPGRDAIERGAEQLPARVERNEHAAFAGADPTVGEGRDRRGQIATPTRAQDTAVAAESEVDGML